MRQTSLLLVLLMIVGVRSARAEDETLFGTDDERFITLLSVSGRDWTERYSFIISKARFAALPAWSPEESTVPLQPQQAAKLATTRWQALYPTAAPREVISIQLESSRQRGEPLKWMYYVHFNPVDATGKLYPPEGAASELIVLLDGTVIGPDIRVHALRKKDSP